MSEKVISQLALLGAHLATKREPLLLKWREAAAADPVQTTVSALTRLQFDDHIPQLLDAFDRKLRARPSGPSAAAADKAKTREDINHGLQRWQQGYRLKEVMHEWGHLHLCLAREVEAYAAAHPETLRETMAVVHEELINLIGEGINESTGQYTRMQQAEATAHARDLERALAEETAVERRRATLLHHAVHDLRTNVQSVSAAADVLGATDLAESERVEFARSVQYGAESLAATLGELLVLARLEAGHEKRRIAPLEASQLIIQLCASARPVAIGRDLFLKHDGPAMLNVEGDRDKIRRILQNLVINALKYTVQGGVTVSWGEEMENWWVMVNDTGPGLMARSAALMVAGLKEATALSRELEDRAITKAGPMVADQPSTPGGLASKSRSAQAAGEGIGLSIVKRLCELLDCSLEVRSSNTGTAFRVVLPRRYKERTAS